MSILLALATFGFFLLLAYLLDEHREDVEKHVPIAASTTGPAVDATPTPAYDVQPVWAAGYQLPEDLHYHHGHTWARPTGPDTVLVGLDDFARRLLGRADGVELPPVGSRLRQGAAGFSVRIDDRTAQLLAPVDGEIVEVNAALGSDPQLATDDPYGRGWVMKLRTTDLARNLRNLLSGAMARKWTENSRERVELELMALSGSVLMDGGRPVADFAAHLEREDWRRLVSEFLLT